MCAAICEPTVDRSTNRLTFALDHAAFAGRNLERGLQRGQARHHGFGLVGDVLDRRGRSRAERNQPVHRAFCGVVDDEFVAGLDQAAGHWEAHLPEADESDFHRASLSL